MTRAILAVNAGSSTVKLALFDAGDLRTIGAKVWTGRASDSEPELLAVVRETVGDTVLAAVGHRIVHGGPRHYEPARVTPELLGELNESVALAPNHLPAAIGLIQSLQRRYAELPHVACFDTGFHRDLPEIARRLPIPRTWDQRGVRRYGFHGLSYEYVIHTLRSDHPELARGRLVLAHLGNGSSLAAVKDGAPVDTSMSFTPLAGPMMSTRSGDIDPGLVAVMARQERLTPDQTEELLGSRSGLLAVSASTGDMRQLLEREAQDPLARLAVDMYSYQIRKWIGSFAAALGGLDGLVFTGGIGEHASAVRARICSGLEFLGITLDPRRNQQNDDVISPADGHIPVHVIRTNEELMIARHTSSALRNAP